MKNKVVVRRMMSRNWKTRTNVDVAMGRLLDTLLRYDGFGRLGSGGSLWKVQMADGSRFPFGRLEGRPPMRIRPDSGGPWMRRRHAPRRCS
eukprot:5961138-Pyramimonas_sp.AAC.1